MSNRRSILTSEEGSGTPGSPLRRSTRIANSPAPAAAPPAAAPAAIARRRSFTAESGATPGKIGRAKRQSLSQEITLEEKTESPAKAAAGTPVKRGRRPSISKVKEEDQPPTKPETPSRRRSVRTQSISPGKDTVTAPPTTASSITAAKRGRRASISQASLEVIKESENKPEEPKKAAPAGVRTRITRRSSVDSTTSTEVEKKETDKKKPVASTRRSIRGRSGSVDIPEEDIPIAKAPTGEVTTIVEEEETVVAKDIQVDDATNGKEKSQEIRKDDEFQKEKEKSIEDERRKEEKQEDAIEIIEIDEDTEEDISEKTEKSLESEKRRTDANAEDINEVRSVSSSDVVSISSGSSSLTELAVTKSGPVVESNDIEISEKVVEESEGASHSPVATATIFKSPVRRSPRLSASPSPSRSPVTISLGEEKEKSPVKLLQSSDASSDQSAVAPEEIVRECASSSKLETPQRESSPRRSPRLSESSDRFQLDQRKSSEKILEEMKSPEEALVEKKTPERTVDEKISPKKAVDEKISPEETVDEKKSPEKTVDENKSPEKILDQKKSPQKSLDEKKITLAESPRRSLRLSESLDASPVIEPEKSPRRSLCLSLKPSERSSELKDPEKVQEVDEDISVVISSDEEVVEEKSPQKQLPRQATSFTVAETTKTTPKTPRLSQSFRETKKTPKRDSLLKRTPEMINGSDGSFHLNLSIPTTNSVDLEDLNPSQKKVEVSFLDISGGSNTSDKENVDKQNTIKSPRNKRSSLSETSTPKLNKSIKVQSFCEPDEIEIATDVVVAQAQVEAKTDVSQIEGIDGKMETSVIEVDNEAEFGSSPVKPLKKMKTDVTQSEEELELELMSSFVDEVNEDGDDAETALIMDEKVDSQEKVSATDGNLNVSAQKSDDIKKSDDKKPEEDIKKADDIKKSEEATKKSDAKASEENSKKSDTKKSEESDGDVFVLKAPPQTKEKKSTTKTAAVPEKNGKKPAENQISEDISQQLEDLINSRLRVVCNEEDSDSDEDYEPEHDFLDDQAMEGEEDTPSEDSNQIIDEGESLHSSESDDIVDDEDYENDSFVITDDDVELLSGHEYDLDDLVVPKKEKKKRKSRIIPIDDSSDEDDSIKIIEEEKDRTEDVVIVSDKSEASAKQEVDVYTTKTEEKTTNTSPPSAKDKKIVVLQNIKVCSPPEVVINKVDNLESLECIQDSSKLDVPREPKTSLATPNDSFHEASPLNTSVGGRPRRKTSISIQDEIKISRYSDGDISEKISKAVDFFVSSIKEKSGNVSVNVSLDYANNSASSTEGSPKRTRRSLNKTDVDEEELDTIVDNIIDDTEKSFSKSMTKETKEKKRLSLKSGKAKIESEVTTKDSEVERSGKKRQSFPKKNVSFNEIVETENVDSVTEKEIVDSELSSPKKKMGKLNEDIKEESTQPLKREKRAHSNRQIEELTKSSKQVGSPVKNKTKKIKTEEASVSEELLPNVQRALYDWNESSEDEKPVKKSKKKIVHVGNESEQQISSREKSTSEVEQVVSSPTKSKPKMNKEVDRIVPGTSKSVKTRSPKKQMKPEKRHLETDVDVAKVSPYKYKKKMPKSMDAYNFEDFDFDQQRKTPSTQEFLVEDEHNAAASTSELSIPMVRRQSKKNVRVKPSKVSADNNWSVQDAGVQKPSRFNKVTVKEQLVAIQKKLAPNDFKNQMLYSEHVKRIDSKDIAKSKLKSGNKLKKK